LTSPKDKEYYFNGNEKNSEFLLIARLQKLRDKGCSFFYLFCAREIGIQSSAKLE
jgi:hypothetical protein